MTSVEVDAPSGVSVVVPVYEGAASVPALYERLTAALSAVESDYELVFVNDGSRDRSWERIAECAQSDGHVRGIDLMRNYGQHNALLCGVRAARYDTIVTLDDDLQHPPEAIPELLAALEDGVDVVYGVPAQSPNSRGRALITRLTKVAMRGLGVDLASDISPFRCFRRRLVEAFAAYASPFVSLDVLLAWGTSRFASRTVTFYEPPGGRSRYTLRKLVNYAVDVTTGFSVVPLRCASWLGLAAALLGLILLIRVFVVYMIAGRVVPGFAYLAATLSFFSGVQLLVLGILGEYIARIHFRSMAKPPYTIHRTTG